MTTNQLLEERTSFRQDTIGRMYRVGWTPCEACGCAYHYSIDEPGVIWEAGDEISADCIDSMCECHMDPVMGLPFELHFEAVAAAA
jgi:hypothetical protein